MQISIVMQTEERGSLRLKQKPEKWGRDCIFMYFGDWNSFTLRQKLESR